MPDPLFFGYGSLVNGATHAYPGLRPARLAGWSRAWRPARGRPVAYLTAVRGGDGIDGAVAVVPDADWAALDRREAAYARHAARCDTPGGPVAAEVYALPPATGAPDPPPTILRSYLDTVIAGFLGLHGEAAARRFFDETDGWDLAIQDDRAAPLYPRHVPPGARAARIVEDGLERVCGPRRVPSAG